MDDDQQFCLRWNNHQSTLISVFDTLLENGTLVDCTLAAEGKFLKAHKVVLSACSPYFAALLSQQYDKHPIFILKDVKFQELRAMMDYMYRGEVNISQDQLAALLKAAESLQIKGLSDGRGSSVKGTDSGNGALPSALQQPKISHPTVPVVSKPGLTIEHKRPRQQHPAATESDVSLSREGSASPTSRKRKKVRRRSIDTNNLPDNHDQLSNSSSQSMPHHQQQQQQQQQSHTSTVNTPAATLPQITSATSAANVLNVTKKTEPSETKKDVEQSVQLQRDQQRDQNADDDDDDDDDQNEMEPPAQRQKHDDYTDKMDSHSEVLIEPKNEYNDVEDLTLEDEDLIDDDPDQAGPSHGGDGSSHGYAQWQIDRGQDDAFMTTTEATGQHRDAQEITTSLLIVPNECATDSCCSSNVTDSGDGGDLQIISNEEIMYDPHEHYYVEDDEVLRDKIDEDKNNSLLKVSDLDRPATKLSAKPTNNKNTLKFGKLMKCSELKPSLGNVNVVTDIKMAVAEEWIHGKDFALREATRKWHNDKERFFCPDCNVKYTKFKYLKTHMKNCGERFKCPHCMNVYKQKRTYVLHIKSKHSNMPEMEAKCDDDINEMEECTILDY